MKKLRAAATNESRRTVRTRSGLAVAAAALAAMSLLHFANAETVFVEAESFASPGGWRVQSNGDTRRASALTVLNGSDGAADGTAVAKVALREAGRYRVWVRYASYEPWRGPFGVAASQGDRELGGAIFDQGYEAPPESEISIWRSFDAELPAGGIALKLSKHENKNCVGYARSVDCLLLTTDLKLVPNHLDYGPQTFVRVTIGEGYARPVYIHVFADHSAAPWYQHYGLASGGAVPGLAPPADQLLASGAQTPWCNITPMIYQDVGAALFISARHDYHNREERLRATFEFATAPDAKAVVRTVQADCQPNGLVICMPPNLATPENIARLKTDREIAEETGRASDAFAWPSWGRKPERFPFFVSASVGAQGFAVDAAVTAREMKTLDRFGFTPALHRQIEGAWFMKNGSYCEPNIEKMTSHATAAAQDFQKNGGKVGDIVYAALMDEPSGQSLDFIANDAAYATQFRAWLKAQGRTPADLLVADWDAVRPVKESQRAQSPALYYYTQRFRTRALGDFMGTQRKVLEKAYGGTLRTLANFSDGAVYSGNFCDQGVDYFELLDSPDQNAIWSEDWANNASTYQCAAYNVDLMRAAARDRGQTIGHYLVAHAGRKSWDIKLKATGELARGVKILNNFAYGPSWASHEGGPYWKSHLWYGLPATWSANAAIVREVGAVEDLLLDAMPAPAHVALLYSSSSDAWTIHDNLATGFDRMHTWLALAHAQVPVDIVSESQAAAGQLDRHRVCYLSGPNLTRAAAETLKLWVTRGGTLWLTAGAATRDEFNRPLTTLDDILPAARGETAELEKYNGAGHYLIGLTAHDEVRWEGGSAEVLCVKQALTPRDGATVLATFKDASAAVVQGRAGEGRVICAGFLPALGYIKPALVARAKVAASDARAERSDDPWEFPAAIRQFILAPVRAAGITTPIACDVPLVDAVFMVCEKGALIPLANHTLQPIERLALTVTVPRPIARVESARHGVIEFQQTDPRTVKLSLPLEINDFVKLYFR